MSKRNRDKRIRRAAPRVEPRAITPDELRQEYERLEADYTNALKELEQARADANAIKGALQLAARFVTMAAAGNQAQRNSAGQTQPDPLECAKTGHVEGEGSKNG